MAEKISKSSLEKDQGSLTSLEKDFIAFYQVTGRRFGMDSLSASLFALLYLSPEPLSLDTLAKKTGYSLASVSLKIRVLEGYGWVERKKLPGSKKVYYYVDKNILKKVQQHFSEIYSHKVEYELRQLPSLLEKHKKTVNPKEKAQYTSLQYYYEQTQIMKSLFEKIQDIMMAETNLLKKPTKQQREQKP